MKPKIILKVSQLRELEKSHSISNILNPSAEDQGKMLTLDFLTEFVGKGTEYMGNARPDVEDLDVKDLLSIFKTWNSPEESSEPGKPAE